MLLLPGIYVSQGAGVQLLSQSWQLLSQRLLLCRLTARVGQRQRALLRLSSPSCFFRGRRLRAAASSAAAASWRVAPSAAACWRLQCADVRFPPSPCACLPFVTHQYGMSFGERQQRSCYAACLLPVWCA